MTLCIGIERRGRVWVGADCAVVSDEWSEPAREPKAWRAGAWVIAGAGDWRALTIVRAAVALAPSDTVTLDVPRKIFGALRQHDYELPADASERPEWLLAYGGALWHLDLNGHACRAREHAIGMSDYARGWLDASPLTDPELRIRECIKAASKRMPAAIRGPALVIAA